MINDLTKAYPLCTCGGVCSRACTVCASVTYAKGPCVQQLWREHTASAAGQAAAQRFNDMVDKYKPGDMVPMPVMTPSQSFAGIKVIDGLPYAIAGNQKLGIDGTITPYEGNPPVLSDAEIVERTIDFVEQLGMYLEPWQAAALRAILLHGGDVEIGGPRQHS